MADEKKVTTSFTISSETNKQNNNVRNSSTEQGSDESQRATWDNGLQFLMSCIAMSVGFGNIWRFPFVAYENGGGAFLIPYIIVLIIIGRPFYYMEMCIGQFTSRATGQAYRAIGPMFEGIAYAQLIGTICVQTYYCCLMAISLFYMVNSFTSNLPWSYCRDEWNQSLVEQGLECVASTSRTAASNSSLSSSELYYKWEVLKEVSQIYDGIGIPDWKLTLCLLFSWIACFVVSNNGVKSSGKFSYFLALFPYVIMFVILIRGVTLEGSATGLLYFIQPQWDKLLGADVWYAAVTQCFFSLNVGFGSIVMYSSYNSFDHPVNRDALIVTTIDTFTSLLSGATIFGILGNLANEMGVEVSDVISTGGSGIAFISYPEAIAKFDQVPWLFAILFFLMLWVLGVGSLVALQSTFNSIVLDAYPNLKTSYVSGATAIIMFLVGLVYVTPGGQFILTLVDFFGGTFVIFIAAVLEIVVLMWVYGATNFCDDVEYMTKSKVSIYWKWMWGFVTPTVTILIFVYFVATITEVTYGSYTYPRSALICGWMIVAVSCIAIIFMALKPVFKNRKLGFPEMFIESCRSTKWKPDSSKATMEWIQFKQAKKEEREKKNQSWIKQKLAFLAGK
ncbi:sodium-dependent nutrient amino acid transporter 1-like [Agrilus planipennis]|uniref:Transporter n=1 Tax=Agrilus planipennis TaxID=224129 RepID=A0A1W4XAC2_AGRPL|nr:sodium-dependent nutrient amino acid transporter 1-like [Agrilus planipennis]